MTELLPVLLDVRAGLQGRTGGWERATTELATRLEGRVTQVPGRAPRHQLTSVAWDWGRAPWSARQFELVHFPAYPPVPLVRTPTVYTLWDTVWLKHPAWMSTGGRLYYRHLAAAAGRRTHLVTGSEFVASELRAVFDVPVEVIPCGVRTPTPGTVPEVRERPYLLTVGAVEPRKNLARLVQAYTRSGLSGRVDLLLVGRAAWGELPPGATHLGAVDDARLDSLYAGALAVVSASLYEGFGLPVAEALAAGTPVVCSDIGAYREIAPEATRFDPLDVDDIARALGRAGDGDLADPPPDARTLWSWDRYAASYDALYVRLLGTVSR